MIRETLPPASPRPVTHRHDLHLLPAPPHVSDCPAVQQYSNRGISTARAPAQHGARGRIRSEGCCGHSRHASTHVIPSTCASSTDASHMCHTPEPHSLVAPSSPPSGCDITRHYHVRHSSRGPGPLIMANKLAAMHSLLPHTLVYSPAEARRPRHSWCAATMSSSQRHTGWSRLGAPPPLCNSRDPLWASTHGRRGV